MSRIPTRSAAIFAAALALSACTEPDSSRKDRLVIAISSPPNSLDPRLATDAVGQRLSGLMYSALVRVGPRLEIVGEAAESWTYDERANAYRFSLRPGLTFPDGRKLASEDILWSLEQFRSPSSPFASSLSAIASAEARYDEKERWVLIKLKEKSAWLLPNLRTVKLMAKPREGSEKPILFSQPPLGTGPYSLKKQDLNRYELEARTDCPYARPPIERAVFKVVRDEDTRTLKAIKGEIDVAQNEIPLAKLDLVKSRSAAIVREEPGLSVAYLLFNMRDPRLSKLGARQAIAASIDRESIIRYKLGGRAVAATGLLSPVHPYANREMKWLPFNLGAAKVAVEKAGLAGASLTLKTSNAHAAIENGKVLAAQLRAAGLDVRLQSYEWGTFYDDVQNGRFELATLKWVAVTDPDLYRAAFHSAEASAPGKPGRNRGGYSNPRLDELLNEATKIMDEKLRLARYAQIQKLVHEELPIAPLWHDAEAAVINPRVQGYEPSPTGDFAGILKARK